MPGSGIWHWGIRCYSSRDLYNWSDGGLIIPSERDDPESPLHPAKNVDRLHPSGARRLPSAYDVEAACRSMTRGLAG